MKRKAHGQRLAGQSDQRRLQLSAIEDWTTWCVARCCSSSRRHLRSRPQPPGSTWHCNRGRRPYLPCRSVASVPQQRRRRSVSTRPAPRPKPTWNGISAWSCHICTTNGQINAWINRAVSDLHMMTTELPPARTPMQACLGSTRLSAATESLPPWNRLWLRPDLARGVLAYLAATQATEAIVEQDAEPGQSPPRNP